MSNIPSYSSIYAVGHSAAAELFIGPVTIEEKIDGSQFSFGVYDGEIRCRSKGATVHVGAPEKMFERAIEQVKARQELLHPGWTYRAEYLQKPKHNTLAYGRVPNGHLMIFDIDTGLESYLGVKEKQAEAERVLLECVPVMYEGEVTSVEQLKAFLESQSVLGAVKVEGFVIKNYARFAPDKKTLMGKYVSEAFKEAHSVNWKADNPQGKDVIQTLIKCYRTDARWVKGVGHLRDAGNLDGSPRDIGNLIKEVQADVTRECSDEIAKALLKWAMPQIMRGITAGLPEWYKNRLLESALEQEDPNAHCKAGTCFLPAGQWIG